MKGEEGGRRKVKSLIANFFSNGGTILSIFSYTYFKKALYYTTTCQIPTLTLIVASCCKSNTYCPKNDWRSRDGAEDDERPEGNGLRRIFSHRNVPILFVY